MRIASLKPTSWVPDQVVAIKPRLRGWLHLVAAPLSLAASIVLLAVAVWAGALHLVWRLFPRVD